jgi:hypothetical protein
MKKIQLTKGQIALVDDQDFQCLSQYNWYAQRKRGKYYAARSEYLGTENGRESKRIIYVHRAILGLEHGDPRIGDHIEPKETLNNQRSNLRIANTNSESQADTRKRANNTSGFKGVTKHGSGYRARIMINNKHKCLGTRKTPEAARSLYAQAAQEHHGEFARTG